MDDSKCCSTVFDCARCLDVSYLGNILRYNEVILIHTLVIFLDTWENVSNAIF